MKAKITKRAVDAAKRGARDLFIWDTLVLGFGLKVTPAGNRIYLFQYRVPGRAAPLRYTIGKHGDRLEDGRVLTADRARAEAERLRGMVRDGRSPARERSLSVAKAKATPNFKDFCLKVYLPDAKSGKVRYRGKAKKLSTLATDEGRINRHIIPVLGKKLVTEIDRRDVIDFMHAVRLGKTATTIKTGPHGLARVTGGEGTARRTLGLLGSIMSYAVELQYRLDNPVRGIEREKDRTRDRVLTTGEYRRLGEALDAADSKSNVIATIRLLALTGFRLGEALGLQWSAINFERGSVSFADTKAGQQTRPIGQAALRVLSDVIRIENTPWVFPASRGEGHLQDTKAIRGLLDSAGLEGVTAHTFRHGFASTALELEYSELTIAGLLGHRVSSVTAKYAHHVDGALAAAANRVSSLIDRRLKGLGVGSGKVIKLAVR